MRLEMMHPADQLITTMDRICRGGLTTASQGNLSIMDQDGSIWITPEGTDKDSLVRNDIVWVSPDGTTKSCRSPSSELSFHLAAYKARPDIRAVLHAHSPAISAFSMMHSLPDFSLIPNTRIVCGWAALMPYEVIGTQAFERSIVEELRKGVQIVILENHGVIVTGISLSQAFKIFETLEFAARSELLARRMGEVKRLSEDQVDIARTSAHTRLSEFKIRHHSSRELELRREITRLIKRGLDQQMFYSSQGTISARVDKNTFLITPFGLDRREITEENLVLVKKGLKEAGKVPSRAVFLHELIYHRNPDIQAIIAAQPPNLMAYTISEAVFDVRIMPESYLQIRQLPLVQYGLNYSNPQQTADYFRNGVSSILLRNDGIITTGQTLGQAYDRIEVAEYSARSVQMTSGIGEIKPMDPDKLAELDQLYGDSKEG